MKFHISHSRGRARATRGWALLAVLTVTGAAVVLLAGVMNWASENSTVANRRNEYFSTAYAAESATEKAFSAIVQDDENYGEGYVLSRLTTYSAMVPTSADDAYWGNFNFSSGTNANSLTVSLLNSNTTTLGAPYTGMLSQGFTYEIVASAQNSGTMYKLPTTVGQKIVLSQIPMFQFAIFYMDDMEVDPGANMTVNGTVHGNKNVYVFPNTSATLTFSNDVSASTQLLQQPDPLDPSVRGAMGTLNFHGAHVSGVNPLNLPSGSGTNALQNGQSILAFPGAGGAANSSLLYNQAQMIVLISNSSVTVTSGMANNQATVVPASQWSLFVSTSTNNGFYDQRDGLQVNAVKLDVGGLRTWVATNTSLGSIDSIYVADLRSTSNTVIITNSAYATNTIFATNQTTTASYPAAGTYAPPVTTNTTWTTTGGRPGAGTYIPPITTNGNGGGRTYSYSKINGYTYGLISQSTLVVTNITYQTNYPVTAQPGIVLTNGATMPSSAGLAVASPDPVYVIGNWNVSTNGTPANLGTANTTKTYPSAIYADAITVLSANWNNANSTGGIASRVATDDTLNAAFFTGNVPSNGGYYSGGVENFPRFLENWSGHTLTYNGSMVEALSSQVANYPWPGTGSVYNPPTRNWAFDLNFNNPSKLPPLTPRVVLIQRSSWAMLPPNSTQF